MKINVIFVLILFVLITDNCENVTMMNLIVILVEDEL